MRSERLTYRDGESSEDVKRYEALPAFPGSGGLLFWRGSMAVLAAGLDIPVLRQQHVVDDDLVGLGWWSGRHAVIALDELVNPHISLQTLGIWIWGRETEQMAERLSSSPRSLPEGEERRGLRRARSGGEGKERRDPLLSLFLTARFLFCFFWRGSSDAVTSCSCSCSSSSSLPFIRSCTAWAHHHFLVLYVYTYINQ